MGGSAAETIRQPRERLRGQPQERQHSATAGGTRDRPAPARVPYGLRAGSSPDGRDPVSRSRGSQGLGERERVEPGPPFPKAARAPTGIEVWKIWQASTGHPGKSGSIGLRKEHPSSILNKLIGLGSIRLQAKADARREQMVAAPTELQPALFELKEDSRPRGEQIARDRYEQPSLFSWPE
jgi:hypothetical protein